MHEKARAIHHIKKIYIYILHIKPPSTLSPMQAPYGTVTFIDCKNMRTIVYEPNLFQVLFFHQTSHTSIYSNQCKKN